MDARHLDQVTIDRTELREIPRRQWTPAAPSRLLHAGLAAGWMLFLWSIGLFSSSEDGGAVPVLSAVEEVILLVLLGTIVAVLATVGLAMMNHRATARISAMCSLAMVAIGTTCGFAGHSISSWGPTTAAAAAIGVASVGVMARRAG